MLDPGYEVSLGKVSLARVKKKEGLVLHGEVRAENPSRAVDLPDERCLSFNKTLDGGSGDGGVYLVKSAYQLSQNPLSQGKHNCRVHMIGVDVPAYVTDAAVISNFIERNEDTRDLDTHGSWKAGRRLLKRSAVVDHILWLCGARWVSTVNVAPEYGVGDLAEFPTIELGWLPAALAVVVDDCVECAQ